MAFKLINYFTGKERTFEIGDEVLYLKNTSKALGETPEKGTVLNEKEVLMEDGHVRRNFDTNNHKWSKTGRKLKS